MYRATAALICINSVMMLLALVGLGYSISVVAQDGRLCVNCLAVPVIWGWAAFGLTLGIVLISLFAIIAAYKHVKSMLIFMSLFTFVTFAASVALTVIILLFTTAQDLGALNPAILSLEDEFKTSLTTFALGHRTDWTGLQNQLGCCGIDLKATYSVPSFTTQLHTGTTCNATVDGVIIGIQAATPDFNVLQQDPNLLKTANAQIVAANGGNIYFCDGAVRQAAQNATVVVGVVLSLLSALQLIAFALSCYLLCGVKKEDGGFAEVDEETGQLQSPLKAFIQAPVEVAQDTKAFANRVSTRIGMNVAPVANRVSTRMGFSPVFNTPSFSMPPIGGPPPGMPPPGMGGFGGGGGGGAPKDFGEKYAKYQKMKKSGLPEGAVRQAMQRDGVECPDGFFDGGDEESGGGGGFSKPPPPSGPRGFGGPPPGLPPLQAMKNLANRVSMNMSKTTNRVSMNMRGLMGGGFAPPPPPPGFGELPPQGMNNSFGGSTSFGGATNNPNYGGQGKFSTQTYPEEPYGAPALPPPSKPSAPPKSAKAATAPKASKAKAPSKKSGGGGGGPGFLADIANGGDGPSTFGLKKTVTNDRSGPNLNIR